MAREIVVIGGGLAGLTASIACAEAGAAVTLHEAHSTLGGRGRTTPPPYVAHEGAHVFYADGPHWTWLVERNLIGDLAGIPARAALVAGFRYRGKLRRRPFPGLLRMIRDRRRSAPVDRDFASWAGERYGAEAAKAAANAISVVTFDADTGRLSAAFVWEQLHRVFAPTRPAVRYVVGGWPTVFARMARRARELGVQIELNSRVTEIPSVPTIVATELASARALLGDDSLTWESGRCVMLDLAVHRRRGDMFIVFDADQGGFHECYTMQDPSLAPENQSLFQLDMPIRSGESRADAMARVEELADLAVPGWRERTTWKRDAVARGRSGALDLPGQTWRDRPAIVRGGDVFLAGDMVAAPGMRGEISMNSAVVAAQEALRAAGIPAASAQH
ncbi:phytoene dehydrogenase-like protein [Saccharothrix tamanrassetensis]|uniref:Phytoene dehydrogenase-like protein n=1 Tax=Saccharothrix tamanrassetensis TaxID=1051531 RepID=A0A841CR65_9PSEU|nr:FAD-dependent oxidoreductase [Saccharothrix tamanrassetensis]MBB5958628.1 phytoene dehydrogenase-like protein [Saccharothrix tamanrassetensis]